MEKVEFQRIRIGEPDLEKVNKIVSVLNSLTLVATDIKWGLDGLYNEFENVSLDLFFEFVKASKPEDILAQRFAEMKNISAPGLSMDKLVSLKLIDIPKEGVVQLLQDRAQFFKTISLLEKQNYAIKLSELYNASENLFWFDPEVYVDKIKEELSVYTSSLQENLVIGKLQNLFESINDLVELGLLPCDRRCVSIDTLLQATFEVSQTEKRPVKVSQQAFRSQRMSKFTSDIKSRTTEPFKLAKVLS